jgi:phage terminase large subunit
MIQPKLIYPEIHLTNKQSIAWDYLTDTTTQYILFGGGAGGAKSWLGCTWLLVMCYMYPGSKWFIGRKELKRLMGSTFITFLKVCQEYKVPKSAYKLDGKYNVIEFSNGSKIDLLDLAHQPTDPLYERFGSLEYTGGWIEEAGEAEYMCFDVLKTRVGRYKNDAFKLTPAKLLLTCNPTQNFLYRVFYKPFSETRLPKNMKFVQALHNDNPFQESGYSQQLDQISDPILKARLRDGLWEYSADSMNLINFDAIMQMFVNTVPDGLTYLTADVARFGSDKIVYGIWRGMNLTEVSEKEKQSTTRTEEDIRDMLSKKFIPYNRGIVDEDGLGGGIVDHLYGINGFMGGRTALVDPHFTEKRNYKNLRSQCYFLLADRINRHELQISAELTEAQRELIITDLQQIKRVDTAADAPLQVIPKEEIKDAIGRSPDYADMLMMRMYFDLAKPTAQYHAPDANKIRAAGGLTEWGGVPFQ